MPDQSETASDMPRQVGGLKILVISKDKLFAHVTKAKLEAWGHSVAIETDMAVALQWPHMAALAVVLVDFDLPNGSGVRLCRRLRATPSPGYVYLLGYGTNTDREAVVTALEAGADGYAHKPLHAGELKACLEHARRLLSINNVLFHASGSELLTGALSRPAFERFLRTLFAQYRRSGETGTLMFIEMANSRAITRSHGLAATQAVEMQLAGRLATLPRLSDMLGRLELGKFGLLLSGTSGANAKIVALRIADDLRSFAPLIDGRPTAPLLTISMVAFPGDARMPAELLETAMAETVATVGNDNGLPPADDIIPRL